MAQNLQIRRAPSGVVIAEKAVDFFTGSVTLAVGFLPITDVTVRLVEDAGSEQLSLVNLSANIAGNFALNGGQFGAQMKFEPVTTGPSTPNTVPAVVVPFTANFILVALNGIGTFGAAPDGPIKVTLEMNATGGAVGTVLTTAGGFNTVFAALVI